MKTTTEFLEGVKAAYGLTSDYKLAKFLGISTASISRLMQKKDFLGDENAIKVANLLKIAPAYVLSCVHFERAKKAEEKAVWQSIIEKFGGLAASVLLGVALFGSVPDFASAQGDFFSRPVYTLYEAWQITQSREISWLPRFALVNFRRNSRLRGVVSLTPSQYGVSLKHWTELRFGCIQQSGNIRIAAFDCQAQRSCTVCVNDSNVCAIFKKRLHDFSMTILGCQH